MSKILLTSFTTWLPHQNSNSSDDLLDYISQIDHTLSLTFLRKLPVDVDKASSCVINKINEISPDIMICCGMAEGRNQLSIESNACCGDSVLRTNIDLDLLVTDSIQISHDAGKFVCEGLYYAVLKYIINNQLNINCIFVHVPMLGENKFAIVEDFMLIIQKLGCCEQTKNLFVKNAHSSII